MQRMAEFVEQGMRIAMDSNAGCPSEGLAKLQTL